MGSHASILSYFTQAGLVVKLVMLLLLVASVISWTLIFQRAWYFKQKNRQYEAFNKRFWACTDLTQLFADIDTHPEKKHGLAAIFHAGFREFLRVRKHSELLVEPIRRVMHIHYAREAEKMETHLPVFASVGSVTPYVGLFGTVWGIMTSLQSLGQAQQATIAMVAPGISEALVATALGLFTAIPAVIAYNRYTTNANTLLNRYDLFQEEFVALIAQQATLPPRE